jgi:hypothetical protein
VLRSEDWEAIVDALSRGFFSSNLIRDIENEILANLPNEGA